MSIQNLLSQVSSIRDKQDEILKKTGENFNIFTILKVGSKEVKTHSAFLAELLNPKGSHEQKDLFLQLFLEEVKKIEIPKYTFNKFDTLNAEAKAEFYIGPKTDTDGGRIDILISSSTSRITIENKIYAPDQPAQLLRYYNYDPNAPLFYLTLNGQEPSVGSRGHLTEDQHHFQRISYGNEILNWLEKCKEKVCNTNHPFLESSITQYIYLIKLLTNKTSSKEMKNEIINEILNSESNLKSYYEVQKIGVQQVQEILRDKLQKELKTEFQNDVIEDATCFFVLSNDILKEKNLKIVIDYETQPYKGFFWGLYYVDASDKDRAYYKTIKSKFVDCFLPISYEDNNSLAWQWFENRDWSEKEFLQVVRGEMLKEIKEKIDSVLEIVKSA